MGLKGEHPPRSFVLQSKKMEDQNIIQRRNKGTWGGLILIVVGVFLFLQNLHLDIPHWVFSWKTLLITLGLVMAAKHNFRGGPWYVMIFVGAIFLTEDIIPFNFNLPRYGWPLALVIIGVYMITKRPNRRNRDYATQKWQEESSRKWSAGSYRETIQGFTSDDYLSTTAIFGGDNRVMLSKNFQGGDITSIFGGSEVNLSQADFTGKIAIEATAIFGGIELVVPANWEVKLEVNTIFGGVEDKRPVELMSPNPDKMLIIRGTCVFGGIDIKSY
jgi:predicted membrane protein